MNEQKYELKTALPKRIAKLIHENHTVKVMAALAYLVAIIAVAGVMITSGRPPTVITLDAEGNKMTALNSSDHFIQQVEEAVREYVKYRYTWSQGNQEQNLKQARVFVSSSALSAFSKVANDLIKFTKEKQVNQRVYVSELNVNEKNSSVQIRADRIDDMQGLKAATILDLKLTYEVGEPSLENPWGIYISKEEEILTR